MKRAKCQVEYGKNFRCGLRALYGFIFNSIGHINFLKLIFSPIILVPVKSGTQNALFISISLTMSLIETLWEKNTCFQFIFVLINLLKLTFML